MAFFKQAYKEVMNIEGGYVNDPNDSGGETYKGIARNRHPSWHGWRIIDSLKGKNFPSNLSDNISLQNYVEGFYKTEFWDKMRLDEVVDYSIARELFDTGVNMGCGVAVEFLQRVLNVSNLNGGLFPDLKVDGIIGGITLSALNGHKRPKDVYKGLNSLQGARYIELCEKYTKNERFFSGWMQRVYE